MPRYLISASYTHHGIQGLLNEGGSSRRVAVEKAVNAVGGSLEAFYYAFGDNDVVTIMSFPDNVTAAGLSLIVAAAGGATTKTTVLLTPEEIDNAVKLHGDYRPPGG